MKYRTIREPLYDLSEHPEHAMAIGELAASWSLVEYELLQIFEALIRSPPWRSHMAFNAVQSVSTRINMIEALASDMMDKGRFEERLKRLLERTRRAGKQRNKYLHALWLLQDRSLHLAEGIRREYPRGRLQKHGAEEIEKATGRIRELADSLGQFIIDYTNANPLTVVLSGGERDPSRGR